MTEFALEGRASDEVRELWRWVLKKLVEGRYIMNHTQKKRRASDTRCARRSLVELTAAASRAVDDGLFVLSSGIAASNPRSEHTGEKTSDQTILARQATTPSPVAVLESRNAAAPRKDELLDSGTTTEMTVKTAKDYQNGAFENIKASLNAALDHAKDLAETRVGGSRNRNTCGGSLTRRSDCWTIFGAESWRIRRTSS